MKDYCQIRAKPKFFKYSLVLLFSIEKKTVQEVTITRRLFQSVILLTCRLKGDS